jgi:hypothetical protein
MNAVYFISLCTRRILFTMYIAVRASVNWRLSMSLGLVGVC